MQVPFLDLKAQHAALEGELTEAFPAIVRGAAFVGGPEVEAFAQAGASVRFVDVLPDTLLRDPAQLAAAITPRTVGVVPVHLYGTPVDMDPIQAIARRHGLWLIEDAAQAHGAVYKGRRVGTMGAMAAFSFYPGKNLGACGEAGAVTSGDRGRLEFVRKLREHGQAQKYFHDVEGYNG